MTAINKPAVSVQAQVNPPNNTTLLEQHRQDWRNSGVSDEYINAQVESISQEEAKKRLNGIPVLSGGWWLTYPELTENKMSSYGVFKPDSPRTQIKQNNKGREIKYEKPCNISPVIFRPSIFPVKDLLDMKTPLFITEGEKKAIKLTQEGFNAISIGGVWNWRTQDKDSDDGIINGLKKIPLAGKEVFCVFDNDVTVKPEVQLALKEFSKYLLSKGATVKVVYLPDYKNLNKKLGADDFLIEYEKEEFEKILTRCFPDKKKGYIETLTPFFEIDEAIEFPFGAFPSVFNEYIEKEGFIMDAPKEFIAAGILAGASIILNKNVNINIVNDWGEYAILWTMLIGRPGFHKKTPTFSIIKKILDNLDKDLEKQYKEDIEYYKKQLLIFQRDKDLFKKGKIQDPPVEPEKPNRQVYCLSDTTTEALAYRQSLNKQGIAIVVDELAHFLKSFNLYKPNGAGNDLEYHLSGWKGTWHTVNRKNLEEPVTAFACHNIFGGIQPSEVQKLLLQDLSSTNGYAERWLPVISDYKNKGVINRTDSSKELKKEVEYILAGLTKIPEGTLYKLSVDHRFFLPEESLENIHKVQIDYGRIIRDYRGEEF